MKHINGFVNRRLWNRIPSLRADFINGLLFEASNELGREIKKEEVEVKVDLFGDRTYIVTIKLK